MSAPPIVPKRARCTHRVPAFGCAGCLFKVRAAAFVVWAQSQDDELLLDYVSDKNRPLTSRMLVRRELRRRWRGA